MLSKTWPYLALLAASSSLWIASDASEAAPPKLRPHEPIPACGSGDPCDCDGDGVRSARAGCGGLDCDDLDRNRFPGNREVCDQPLPNGESAADHDEDCDPCTVAAKDVVDGDADHDGAIAERCTNPASGSLQCGRQVRVLPTRVTGTDCRDDVAALLPGGQWCVAEDKVAVCHPAGRSPDGQTSVELWCPKGTRCVTQPNGVGVCH